MEQWKTVEGYPLYEISNQGRVRRISTGHVLTGAYTSNGYVGVTLYNGSVSSRKTRHVHRLVAEAFCVGRLPDLQVLHRNGDKTDNRASNLSWGTAQENADDRVRMGELRPNKGTDHWNCKITDDEIVRIRADKRLHRVIADQYGVAQSYVSMVKSGKLRA